MKTIVEENTFVDYIREEETIGWGGGDGSHVFILVNIPVTSFRKKKVIIVMFCACA